MGNSKNIKRYMKREYGPRKMQLPKSLEFLSSVNFHAIVEDRSSERTIRTVEIKPRALKNLIEKMDFLDQYLAEHTELVKSLKSNIRKLRADNSGLSENQKLSERLSLELDRAQEKILILTKKIEAFKEVNSESSGLQQEVTKLKGNVEDYKKEIERLARERLKIIELESQNKALQDKIERLEKVNAQLMENIALSEENEKIKHRNKNKFFGGDAKEMINNTKPYRG